MRLEIPKSDQELKDCIEFIKEFRQLNQLEEKVRPTNAWFRGVHYVRRGERWEKANDDT